MTDRPRVLVVDDDFAVASLHRGFVEAHGGLEVVGTAHDGAQALRLAEELAPDLVLLDVYLPDMTGIEVLRGLRERAGGAIEVIAITAARELDTVRAAVAGGVLHYLVKPFTVDVLHDRLDDFLHHRVELERTALQQGSLDQAQVDRLLEARRRPAQPVRPHPASPLPKGLARPTMDAVRAALRASEDSASALEIGEQVGVSRVSARRYLEHLVAEGAATVAPRYGAGRPEHRYVWGR